MASSDRGFRALAQESPDSVIAILRRGAAAPVGPLAHDARITPANVDDPHLGALTPVLDADWVARVGDRDVVHVECQGYRDTTFSDRLLRYHLHLALRYWGRHVHTFAVWLVAPPRAQRRTRLAIGVSVMVRVTHVVVAELPAASLLESPDTACFAAGADAGSWSEEELCARVAEALDLGSASWATKHMAVIAAALRGRYASMVSAMEKRGMQPIVIEDLVKFGEDRGEARGEARGLAAGALAAMRSAVLDVLDARGFLVPEALRERVLGEASVDRLRAWMRRASVASEVAGVFDA